MIHRYRNTRFVLALSLSAISISGPVMADRADKGAGPERSLQHRQDRTDDRRGDERNSHVHLRYFQPQQHVLVREYYAEHYGGRRCPPGLAKGNNGCMPTGQAKKWRIGYRLPADVIYYSVPAPLIVQIGAPPVGHRYVRVAGDILLLAVGTSMVVDAVQDLGRM